MTAVQKPLFSNQYLRRLIAPLVLEQTLAITVGLADTMMISAVGEAAVSGVSLVDMINNLLISVLAALATGGAVVCSQLLGARRRQDACRAANQLCYTAVLGGVIVMVLVGALCRPLLRLLFGSIAPDVMENAVTYMLISALAFPFLALYNACAALFRSMGNSRVTLRVSILMNIINVAGNALCVMVLKMGVAGVAIPSLVSRATAALILWVLLRRGNGDIQLIREKLRLDKAMISRILYIGIPSGIENGIFQLGRVLVVSVISTFGTVQIAANGVANGLDGVSVIMGQAMGLAMITVIGQCVGAGDEAQVRYYTKKLMKITYIGQSCVVAVLMILLQPILSLYGLSEETRRLTAALVRIHGLVGMVLWPMAFVLPNMLRACNDVRFTMVVSIGSMFVFRIMFSWILGRHLGWGVVGVWVAMVIDWVCRVCFFVGRYLRGDWRKAMEHKI